MTSDLHGLPSLDAHAHIAPDVTSAQLRALGHSHSFAMTRSLDEADSLKASSGTNVTWALGVHPASATAQATYDERWFASLAPGFAIIGEVGLDGKAKNRLRQSETLSSILRVVADQPVLLSLHSAGATTPLLDVLDRHAHPGVVFHWWTDEGPNLNQAIASGAYFSVNAAAKPSLLRRLPPERVLTETDFPALRRVATKPGDTAAIESGLADTWSLTPEATRVRLWTNLRRLVVRAGALDRIPDALANLLERV